MKEIMRKWGVILLLAVLAILLLVQLFVLAVDLKLEIENTYADEYEVITQETYEIETSYIDEIEYRRLTLLEDLENKRYEIPLDKETQDYIFRIAECYNVAAELIISIIRTESEYTENCTGFDGEQGYMQIHPINFDELEKAIGTSNYYDGKQNIRAGAYMLSELSKKYDTVEEILMCYNCGESGAKDLWEKGIKETDYTKEIIHFMENLQIA